MSTQNPSHRRPTGTADLYAWRTSLPAPGRRAPSGAAAEPAEAHTQKSWAPWGLPDFGYPGPGSFEVIGPSFGQVEFPACKVRRPYAENTLI